MVGMVGMGRARAQGVDVDDATAVKEHVPAPTNAASGQGAFLPLTLPAAVPTGNGVVVGLGGYDGARKAGLGELAAEVRVWGPVALRGGGVYSAAQDRLRPSVGARVQVLAQERVGIDGAIGIFYRPEGLTEPEGEIETVIAMGRRVGTTMLLGNLAYGQDPEGNERDGEIRLAALTPIFTAMRVGVDGRWRFDLGSNEAKLQAAKEPTFDLAVGPIANVLVGPLALTAQSGVSAVRFVGSPSASVGAFAMAGVGSAF